MGATDGEEGDGGRILMGDEALIKYRYLMGKF